MTSPRTRVDLYYASRFGASPAGIVFAPGRVVLLGEHLDHQGGRVLAVALEQGVYVAWGVRPDRRVTLHALNARAADTFEAERPVRSGRRWADLARGVAWRLGQEGRRLPGLDLVGFGDLPVEGGLASSAAWTVALLRAFTAAIDAPRAPRQVAEDVAAIEQAWAGVSCGAMDPYVAMVGAPGDVLHLDTSRLDHERLALPEGVTLVPRDTGIRRKLSDTPYDRRREELRLAVEAIRRVAPDLPRLVDLSPEAFRAVETQLDEVSRRRARHVVSESRRVGEAVRALGAGDADALGRLMDEGHASLRDDYECSSPTIDELVDRVREEPGVLGVRLQGAGWGGSLAVLRR